MSEQKKRSQSWKDLEKLVASKAKEYGLRAKRVSRGADFGKKSVDVKIYDAIFLKIDGKYRKSHAHHTTLAEIKRKYCSKLKHVEVMVSKHHNQQGAFVSVPLDFFMWLLAEKFAKPEKRLKRWYRLKKKSKRKKRSKRNATS